MNTEKIMKKNSEEGPKFKKDIWDHMGVYLFTIFVIKFYFCYSWGWNLKTWYQPQAALFRKQFQMWTFWLGQIGAVSGSSGVVMGWAKSPITFCLEALRMECNQFGILGNEQVGPCCPLVVFKCSININFYWRVYFTFPYTTQISTPHLSHTQIPTQFPKSMVPTLNFHGISHVCEYIYLICEYSSQVLY